MPDAVLWYPPLIEDQLPLDTFPLPLSTPAVNPEAKLQHPPPTVAKVPEATLQKPPTTDEKLPVQALFNLPPPTKDAY